MAHESEYGAIQPGGQSDTKLRKRAGVRRRVAAELGAGALAERREVVGSLGEGLEVELRDIDTVPRVPGEDVPPALERQAQTAGILERDQAPPADDRVPPSLGLLVALGVVLPEPEI